MRECVYKAGLLTSLNSNNLEFTTERMSCCIDILILHTISIPFLEVAVSAPINAKKYNFFATSNVISLYFPCYMETKPILLVWKYSKGCCYLIGYTYNPASVVSSCQCMKSRELLSTMRPSF